MTRKPKPVYYRREFLNRPGFHNGAHILAVVDADTAWQYLTIADCRRPIRFEFDLHGPPHSRNAIRKASLLVDVLTGLRDALTEAQAAHRRR